MEALEDRRMLSVTFFGDALEPASATMDASQRSPVLCGRADGDTAEPIPVDLGEAPSVPTGLPRDTSPLIPMDATPTGESYFVFEEWRNARTWCDAEKSPSDPDDDALCWAAGASNILSWGGWDVGEMDTCDEIFAHIQDHSVDTAAFPGTAWRWWFEGGPIGPMDESGGAYFPEYDLDYWSGTSISGSGLLADVHYLFQAGYGVTLALGGPATHIVTCWGLNYDPDTGEYVGIWITDSDDSAGSEAPPDRLRYFETTYTGSNWYLQDYYGSDSWYIDRAYALMGNPDALTPAPDAVIGGIVFDDLNEDGSMDAAEPGLADVSVLLDTNGNGVHDDRSASFSTGEAVTIVDEAYVMSTLDIDTEITSITDLNLTLDITHSYNSHLTAWLIAPDGTSIPLFVAIGGFGDNFDNATFDDEAATSARDVASGTITGTLRPFYSLSEFDGIDPNGRWQLKLYDRYGGDTGTLNGWSLEVAESEQVTSTDESGYFFFADLPEGTYTVIAAVPDGYTPTGDWAARDIALADGETVSVDIGVANGGHNPFGDLTGDGLVSSQDLDIVRSWWGQTVPSGSLSQGDPSGDGKVDSADLDIIRATWGKGTIPASAAASSEDTGTVARRICGPRLAPEAYPTCTAQTDAAFEDWDPAEAAWRDALEALESRLRMKIKVPAVPGPNSQRR